MPKKTSAHRHQYNSLQASGLTQAQGVWTIKQLVANQQTLWKELSNLQQVVASHRPILDDDLCAE